MERGGAGRGEEARGKEARSGDQMATLASCHGLPSFSLNVGSLVGLCILPTALPSAESHLQVGSDMAVHEDLWELLEEADGE